MVAFNEKRSFNRLHLDDLSSRIFLLENNEEVELDYFPINVSEDGLSIYTRRSLPIQATIILELSKKKVFLMVIWCKPKEDDPALFRCGLKRKDLTDNLQALIKQELSY